MGPLRIAAVAGWVSLLCPAVVLAGGAINNQNLSSDYIRTLNRNAATDAADVVFFNPAATVRLRPGWTVDLAGQFVAKDYGNTVVPGSALAPLGGGGNLFQERSSFVPALFVNYRRPSWAAFLGIANVAGGGKVDYTQGDWTTYQGGAAVRSYLALPPPAGPGLSYDRIASQHLQAKGTAVEVRVGGAYRPSPVVSVAAGVRYVDFDRSADARVRLEDSSGSVPPVDVAVGFEENAGGWGGFAGICLTPLHGLDVGIRYETEVGLRLEQTVTGSDVALGGVSNPALRPVSDGVLAANGVTTGGRVDENLPSLIGLGVGYALTPRLRVEIDVIRYLNESAALDRPRFRGFDDSWEFGTCAELTLDPRWKVSAGVLITRPGVKARSMLPERPELNTIGVGFGFVWTPDPRFDLSVGAAANSYENASFNDEPPPLGTGARVTLSKAGSVLAAGLTVRP